jgi:hypothetical protein
VEQLDPAFGEQFDNVLRVAVPAPYTRPQAAIMIPKTRKTRGRFRKRGEDFRVCAEPVKLSGDEIAGEKNQIWLKTQAKAYRPGDEFQRDYVGRVQVRQLENLYWFRDDAIWQLDGESPDSHPFRLHEARVKRRTQARSSD